MILLRRRRMPNVQRKEDPTTMPPTDGDPHAARLRIHQLDTADLRAAFARDVAPGLPPPPPPRRPPAHSSPRRGCPARRLRTRCRHRPALDAQTTLPQIFLR